ncbi:E3 ubiquitin-protein ligase Zswim2 [Cichlidogyrus casuarinus]|uniref:E3 ubiquitin-protein ligase Zswim2 n=1 Tax=Cichlidogyrus casuarinus TaxID=1844966 RepID=A0ABD2QH30_9PLAT
MKKFRRLIPEIVVQRQSQAERSEFYLIRTIGPTGFLLKDGAKSVKTFLGEEHSCECENFKNDKDLCQHICWILLKRFKLNKNDPISWQSGLVKRDIDELMTKTISSPLLEVTDSQSGNPNIETEEIRSNFQRKIESNDVCPICQEYFYAPIHRRPLVTYCKYGCGKSVHIKCIKVWMEHQQKKSSTSSDSQKNLSCPMCRGDFNEVKHLKEEFQKEKVDANTKIPTATRTGSEIFLQKYKAPIINHPHECSVCHKMVQGKLYQEIEDKRFFCWTCFKDSVEKLNFQCFEKPNDKPYKVGHIIFKSKDSPAPVLCQKSDILSARLHETVYSRIKSKSWQCRGCLMNFQAEDIVMRLPNCGHVFHSQCIRSYLLNISATCPIDGVAVAQLPKLDNNMNPTTTTQAQKLGLEVIGSSKIQFSSKKQDLPNSKSNKISDNLDSLSGITLHVTRLLKPQL